MKEREQKENENREAGTLRPGEEEKVRREDSDQERTGSPEEETALQEEQDSESDRELTVAQGDGVDGHSVGNQNRDLSNNEDHDSIREKEVDVVTEDVANVAETSGEDPHEKEQVDEKEEPVRESSKELAGNKAQMEEEEKELPDQEEEKKEKEEITVEEVDYSTFSLDDLVDRLALLLEKRPVNEIRNDVERIKVVFYKKLNQEKEEKKNRFLEEGGDPTDFTPPHDVREERMIDLLKAYRYRKAQYNKELEEQKLRNLEEKKQVIEELKELVTRNESLGKTFQEFRDLQKKWRNIGPVPQQYTNELWESYHYHVEKFYDYIRINKELRDLDLKKNKEAKLRLCEQAEQLLLEPDIVTAFKTLQKYHEQWREIGPVPKEHKAELWERFKEATRKINKKYQAYFQEIKEIQKKNLEQKTLLAEKAEEIAAMELKSPREWEEKTEQIRELQKVWRTIGFAPRKYNNAIYERFRKACDLFFSRKREFFAANKELQMTNLQLKTDLCVQAEALKDSTDWKKTTEDLINLQKRWKEIGPVPRKYSDQLWKRFRAACDHFFEAKARYYQGLRENFEENLRKKEELLEEMRAFTPTGDTDKDFAAIQDLQRRWSEIGYVPLEKKEEISNAFRKLVDELYNKLNLNEHTKSLIKYKAKLQELAGSPKATVKLQKDREKFISRIKQLENDITIWENNIGFFSNSKNAESLIRDVTVKIENAKASIRLLKEKLKLIDEMDID